MGSEKDRRRNPYFRFCRGMGHRAHPHLEKLHHIAVPSYRQTRRPTTPRCRLQWAAIYSDSPRYGGIRALHSQCNGSWENASWWRWSYAQENASMQTAATVSLACGLLLGECSLSKAHRADVDGRSLLENHHGCFVFYVYSVRRRV